MALAGLSAVFLFEMLDNSILNVALPTIGRELHASTTALQWVTGAYAVVFGGLMLAFGAIADRYGRRRIMLIGLVAARRREPGDRVRRHRRAAHRRPGGDGRRGRDDDAGLDGAGLPAVRRRRPAGPRDHPHLHRGPGRARDRPDRRRLRARGRALAGPAAGERADRRARDRRRAVRHRRGRRGRAAPRSARRAGRGAGHGDDRARARRADAVRRARAPGPGPPGRPLRRPSWRRSLFVLRERSARHPLLDLEARRAPAGLQRAGVQGRGRAGDRRPRLPGDAAAAARLGLDARARRHRHAAAGRRPHRGRRAHHPVRAAGRSRPGRLDQRRGGRARARRLRAAGPLRLRVGRARPRAGGRRACAWSASSPGSTCSAACPQNRTTIGAALIDTATEVTSGVGIAVTGTVLAALFTGSIATSGWSAAQTAEFREAVTIAGLALTAVAAALVGWGFARARRASSPVDGRGEGGGEVPLDVGGGRGQRAD